MVSTAPLVCLLVSLSALSAQRQGSVEPVMSSMVFELAHVKTSPFSHSAIGHHLRWHFSLNPLSHVIGYQCSFPPKSQVSVPRYLLPPFRVTCPHDQYLLREGTSLPGSSASWSPRKEIRLQASPMSKIR